MIQTFTPTCHQSIKIYNIVCLVLDKDFIVKEEVVIKKPKRQKTNLEEQIEFFEPEEAGSVFNNLKDSGGFSKEYNEADNMPKFGDAEILSQLEKLSQEPTKPVRKATTGAKRGRKPKAK